MMDSTRVSLHKRVLAIAMTVIMAMTCVVLIEPVYGTSYPYDSPSKRTAANQKMYDLAANSHTSADVLARYQDKSLKDMYETKEKGMTSAQLAKVTAKANEILAEREAELGKTSLTDYEKLRAFHDWIIEHFYYYKDVNKLNATYCDNPWYLIAREYVNNNGKIRSRCNGYSATFIAFARSQDIPARDIGGYYLTTARKNPNESGWATKESLIVSHHWSQAYVDRDGDGVKEWIVVDCNADCWNSYSESTGYKESGKYYDPMVNIAIREAYFDVSAERLGQSHIIMEYRGGSKNVQYLTNATEAKALKKFLNTKYLGKSNGKRINSSYTESNPATWFPKNTTKCLGDGNGNVYKLYLPASKKLYGRMDLSGFGALQNFECVKNKLTHLYLKNCPKLTTVSASTNNIKYVDTTGSKKLTLLSVQGNPTVSVKYTFNTKRTATIKVSSTKAGTVSVKYSKSGSKHKHTMTAFAKKGYKFKGWYSGSKRVSKSSKLTSTKSTSFTYVAKFVRK